MARIDHELSHLIQENPKAAKARILRTLRETKMHIANAAAEIGCTHGTLLVWMKKLDMRADVDKLKEMALRQGWFHENRGGRPRLTDRERERRARERKEQLAAMTPLQKKRLEAKRAKKREARIAAMTPKERKVHLAKKSAKEKQPAAA